MTERFHNPFQGIDISVPIVFREEFAKYCQTGGRSSVDLSPFPRMVDLWFLAVCVAARLRLKPADASGKETYKIIEGSIFASDPWRIHALMLVALAYTSDLKILAEPRQMMSIANGLAVEGLPKVVAMLSEGDSKAIWNLSESLERLLTAEGTVS